LYTSCVLGLRPFAFFNELLLIKKEEGFLESIRELNFIAEDRVLT
jgi:hypothetical protein